VLRFCKDVDTRIRSLDDIKAIPWFKVNYTALFYRGICFLVGVKIENWDGANEMLILLLKKYIFPLI